MTTAKQSSPLMDLLTEELRDLLHAEGQLVKAIPKMAEAAHHPKLKEAFQAHLKQTETQIGRLKEAFQLMGEKATPKPCKAMMGLVEEGKETIEEGAEKEPFISDLGLITAAHKVEHYEISGYSSARSLAIQAGAQDVAELLGETLAEEAETADMLSELSLSIMSQGGKADERAGQTHSKGKAQKASA